MRIFLIIFLSQIMNQLKKKDTRVLGLKSLEGDIWDLINMSITTAKEKDG